MNFILSYAIRCMCLFIWSWRTPFSISCKTFQVVINFLSFCLGKIFSPLYFWRSVLLSMIFFAGIFFFFQSFEYIISFPPCLQGIRLKICWLPYEGSLVCAKSLFFHRFQNFLFDYLHFDYNMSQGKLLCIKVVWGSLSFMDLNIHILFKIWEGFRHYLFK